MDSALARRAVGLWAVVKDASVVWALLVPTLALLLLLANRVWGHPLRSYPGPFWDRATGLPALYHAWKGDFHYYLYNLHEGYGPWVRYGPNRLSIDDPDAFQDIYGFNKNDEKPEEAYSAFRVNKFAVNTFNTCSKEAHRRKRRIMAKGFSEAALDSYESSIVRNVDELTEKLQPAGAAGWATFDLAHEANCLMLDVMGKLCFGSAFGFVAAKGDGLMRQFHARAVRVYMRLYLDRLLFPSLLRASSALAEYAGRHTSERVRRHRSAEAKDVEAPADILSVLLNATDDESNSQYTDNELFGESVLLMMAGSDTTSTAITSALFYLAHHPADLQRVQAELDATFRSARDIRPQAAEQCRYLRACTDEAMRLCPPSPTNIPRRVGAGGLRVAGHRLPAGVWVGVPNFRTFRHPAYFARPHAFDPSRWIPRTAPETNDDDSGHEHDEALQRAKRAFYPFSLGPRACIGKRLALREVAFIVARLLYALDVEPVGSAGILPQSVLRNGPRGGCEEGFVMAQTDVFTSIERGIHLRFRPRVARSGAD